MKKSVRKTALPARSFWLSRSASASARPIINGTDIRANLAVTPMDWPTAPLLHSSFHIRV